VKKNVFFFLITASAALGSQSSIATSAASKCRNMLLRTESLPSRTSHVIEEIIDGQLVSREKPRPAEKKIRENLYVLLENSEISETWIFRLAPTIQLQTRGQKVSIVRPDLAGWKIANLPQRTILTDESQVIEQRPDWICEVRADSTGGLDSVTKSKLYARHGVPFYWILDRPAKMMEAFQLSDRKNWIVRGAFANRPVQVEPFSVLQFNLRDLYPIAARTRIN
jgi:hypothetical protein